MSSGGRSPFAMRCVPPQLEQPAVVAQAHGVALAALAGVLQSIIARIHQLEKELDISLKAHPDRRDLPQSARTCDGPRRPGTGGVR